MYYFTKQLFKFFKKIYEKFKIVKKNKLSLKFFFHYSYGIDLECIFSLCVASLNVLI